MIYFSMYVSGVCLIKEKRRVYKYVYKSMHPRYSVNNFIARYASFMNCLMIIILSCNICQITMCTDLIYNKYNADIFKYYIFV